MLDKNELMLFNKISELEEKCDWLKDHYFQLVEDIKYLISEFKKEKTIKSMWLPPKIKDKF